VKKQPKPVTAWSWLQKGEIDMHWITTDSAKAADWRECGFRVAEVRIVPVAPKKRAKAKRGGK